MVYTGSKTFTISPPPMATQQDTSRHDTAHQDTAHKDAALQSTMENPAVDLLLDPRNYSERTAKVELVETHISWIFLTDRYAYKLKKPVCFDFLDFRFSDARRTACEDEFRLNRRLAPHVYLGVVPITRGRQGKLAVDGQGTPIDWLVKMRRLPADRTLEQLILTGQIKSTDTAAVASLLASFYTRLGPLTITPGEYLLMIEDHVRANHIELAMPRHQLSQVQVERVSSAQLRFLCLARKLFDERVCDGRIVEGHGDLRPEHIYLEHPPAIIDCVEFSKDLRTIDVADELSFLAMECERLGAENVGQQILDAYCQSSNDHPARPLLTFYKCYRACVRAKVYALRATQTSSSQTRASRNLPMEYIALADKYAAMLGPPLLIVVRGLMGSGKSTLGTELNKSVHARLLRTDVIRDELFGPNDTLLDYGQGRYREEDRRSVYDQLLGQARHHLEQSVSVILDGTFLTKDLRSQAHGLAQQTGAKLLVIHCDCPEEVARQRIRNRFAAGQDASEARPELLTSQIQEDEPAWPAHHTLRIDTTNPLHRQVDLVLARLATDFSWS
ncbi:MAG: AAA family ATPase [Pirellulales bacterium]